MADTKLSALDPLATEMADTDEIYINDSGVSKRQLYSVFKAAFTQPSDNISTLTNDSGFTDDQTGAEIKAAYEAELDTNAYDDAAVSSVASATQPSDNISTLTNDSGFTDDTTADAALPKGGGEMSGNITMAGSETVDGRDISADGGVLDTAVQPDVAQEYTKAQNFNATTLTDGANISWDLESNQVAKVTLAGNRTLDNPTNMVDGATYILRVIQDAGGTNTLAYGTAYLWPGGTGPVITATGDAIDIITFVSDGTNMFGVISQDFS